MAAHHKTAQQLARQLFKLSVVNGAVSAEQVTGVLAYLEKHQPPHLMLVLRPTSASSPTSSPQPGRRRACRFPRRRILASLAGALSQKYKRVITATARQDARLIAGLRVRVGDDVTSPPSPASSRPFHRLIHF
jgi:F-type H+-transporting ATPase subunit delta